MVNDLCLDELNSSIWQSVNTFKCFALQYHNMYLAVGVECGIWGFMVLLSVSLFELTHSSTQLLFIFNVKRYMRSISPVFFNFFEIVNKNFFKIIFEQWITVLLTDYWNILMPFQRKVYITKKFQRTVFLSISQWLSKTLCPCDGCYCTISHSFLFSLPWVFSMWQSFIFNAKVRALIGHWAIFSFQSPISGHPTERHLFVYRSELKNLKRQLKWPPIYSLWQRIRNYRPQHPYLYHDNHQIFQLMQVISHQNARRITMIRLIFRSVKNWFVTSTADNWNVWCA